LVFLASRRLRLFLGGVRDVWEGADQASPMPQYYEHMEISVTRAVLPVVYHIARRRTDGEADFWSMKRS
jgi:hypothetical protein